MTDMMITGIDFWRRQRRLSIQALAQMTGIGIAKLRDLAKGTNKRNTPTSVYMDLSKALAADVDDLLKIYPESELEGLGNYCSYASKTDSPRNCIAVYRRQKGLTYEQLAALWGSPCRESGREACARAEPRPKHIKALAAYEGISEEEFRRKYSGTTA